MDELHCRGLIINRTPVNEVDAMVRVICEDGVWGFFLPRGFLGSGGYMSIFRPMNWVDILFSEKRDLRVVYDYREHEPVDPGVLDRAEERELFFQMIRIYSKIMDAAVSMESGKLFTDTYKMLVENRFPVEGLRFSFLSLFLLHEGIFPSIEKCGHCGTPLWEGNRFSLEGGGFFCTTCAGRSGAHAVEGKFYRALDYIRNNPDNTLMRSNWNTGISRYNGLLSDYLAFHFSGGVI